MVSVKLIAYTPEPEKVVAAAARLCYSAKSANEIMDGFAEGEEQRFLQKLVDMGHASPTEHASFTFAIEGVSRALTHQLVRHRIGASYSQKSQRYVKEHQFEYITPPSIERRPEQKELFEKTMAQLQDVYEQLVAAGIKAEDARYVLPNAAESNIVVTMNARSLHHFFSLRCCQRAQWEIRELADLMLAEVKKVAPVLFSKAGAPCDAEGVCYEGSMSCGRCENVIKR